MDTTWYLTFADECTGVSALDVSYALEEASKLVGEAACPYYLVLLHFYQMPVFECVAVFVNDCTHKMVRVCWVCILATGNALRCHCIFSFWLVGVYGGCCKLWGDHAHHVFS